MVQYSVYSRMCNGNDMTNKHLKRLDAALPPNGSVRCLTITEKQYENMKFLVGKPTAKERKNKCRTVKHILTTKKEENSNF